MKNGKGLVKVEYMPEDDQNGEGWCHIKMNWRLEIVSK